MTLSLIFTINSITATEPEDGFCLNKLQGQDLKIADIWLVYTHSLDKNPVSGQFLKYGFATLEENALTIPEIDFFLTNYGTNLRFGEGNYFLLKKENGSIVILAIDREDKTFSFKEKSLYEVILQKNFIYIMIPKKEPT